MSNIILCSSQSAVRDELSVCERFIKYISTTNTKCWDWLSSKDRKGYGELNSYKYGTIKAHRISYALFKGYFHFKLFVCHHCDNPSCCNPEHLFLGDVKDNSDDRKSKGKMWLKLSNETKQQLIHTYQTTNLNQFELAKLFNISQTHVSRITLPYVKTQA